MLDIYKAAAGWQRGPGTSLAGKTGMQKQVIGALALIAAVSATTAEAK